MKYKAYTDGSYQESVGAGGCASVILDESNKVIKLICNGYKNTTNNRMELTAILTALRIIDQIESSRVEISIVTDSAYCCNAFNEKWYVNWLNNGWKTSDKRDVKNQDLWSEIIALYIKNKKTHNLTIGKVKAHATNKFNKLADEIAVLKRKELEI